MPAGFRGSAKQPRGCLVCPSGKGREGGPEEKRHARRRTKGIVYCKGKKKPTTRLRETPNLYHSFLIPLISFHGFPLRSALPATQLPLLTYSQTVGFPYLVTLLPCSCLTFSQSLFLLKLESFITSLECFSDLFCFVSFELILSQS